MRNPMSSTPNPTSNKQSSEIWKHGDGEDGEQEEIQDELVLAMNFLYITLPTILHSQPVENT